MARRNIPTDVRSTHVPCSDSLKYPPTNRKGCAMSKCPEYFDLHQNYVEALRRWSEASLGNDEAKRRAAEDERDVAFRKVWQHRETCSQCDSDRSKDVRP
jgi:hypothetical protein